MATTKTTNLSQFIGKGGTPGYLGANAVSSAMKSGLSMSDISRLASQQGLSFGPAALSAARAPSTMAAGLRIAGAGGISKGELQKFLDSGKSAKQVITQLDKANQRLKEQGKTGINLNSGAANMLIRQASKSRSLPIYNQSPFGTGRLGSTLASMVGSPGFSSSIKGQNFSRPGSAPTLLARGMDLMPSGRQTVRGVGKQYEAPSRFTPVVNDAPPGSPPAQEVAPIDPILPPQLPEETMAPGPGMMSGGGMGAAGANKLGRAKSRLRKLGIYGRGTSLLGRGLQYGNTLNA